MPVDPSFGLPLDQLGPVIGTVGVATIPTPGQGIAVGADGQLSAVALDAVYSAGKLVAQRHAINFAAGMTVTDNPGADRVDVSPAEITGVLPASGTTKTAGTGFTYTHTNGTGVYVMSFSPSLSGTPIVNALGGTVDIYVSYSGLSASGVTFTWRASGGVATDVPFTFEAKVAH